MRQQEQVSRIDGHAEMEHLAPGVHDAAGDDVPAIDDRGRTCNQNQIRARIERTADGQGDGAGIVVATGVGHDAPAQCLDAGPQHPGGLVQHRLSGRREPGLNHGGVHRLEGHHPNRRLRPEAGHGALEHRAGNRERYHLDRREHLSFAHRPQPPAGWRQSAPRPPR